MAKQVCQRLVRVLNSNCLKFKLYEHTEEKQVYQRLVRVSTLKLFALPDCRETVSHATMNK